MKHLKIDWKKLMIRVVCILCVICLLLTMFISVGSFGLAEEVRCETVEVRVGTLIAKITTNVRQGPGTEHPVLTAMSPGETCIITGEEGDWYSIEYGEVKGYIAREYIQAETYETQIPLPTATPAPTETPTAMPGYELVEVTIGTVVARLNINVRRGPGTEHDVLMQMAPGDTCTLVEDEGNEDETVEWYHIQIGDVEGYAAKEYMEVRTELIQVPLATSTPEPTATPEPTEAPTERPSAEPGYEWTQVTMGTLIARTKTNIRAGAGTEHDIVGHMSPGETCTVLGEEGDWYRVVRGTYQGYIAKEYIEISVQDTQVPIATATPEPTETPVPEETAAPGYEMREMLVGTVISEANAGIRAGAGMNYDIITYIAPGKTCFVLDDEMEWYEVQYGGYIGYIAKEYLQVEEKVTQVPLITPSPVPTEEPTVTAAPTAVPDVTDLPAAMPGYEWVERKEGTLDAQRETNVRQGPGTDYDIVTRMNPGDTCRVLGETEGWYRIEFEGVKGYIASQYITTRSYMEQVEIVEEDPLDAQLSGLELVHAMVRRQSYSLRGIVDSNIPMTGVDVSVYNRRSMTEEMNVSVQFARDEEIYEFDLFELDGDMRFRRLEAGEKRLTITVYSTNDQQVVLEQDLYVIGECAEETSITGDCELSSSAGRADRIRDNRYSTAWEPEKAGDTLTITAPNDIATEVLTLEWSKAPAAFEVILDGETIAMTNEEGLIQFNIKTGGARQMSIRASNSSAGICEARVYAQGMVPDVVPDWQTAGGKVDMMVIAAHPGDEFLYFGGAIPQAVAEGKNVLVVYMADCGRERMAEAMEGLWAVGVKTHPVCLGLENGNPDEYEDAIDMWGLEESYEILVEVLRRYKPDVVLTHDIEGEEDQQHKLTSATLRRALLLSIDPETYPDSYEKYGAWDVKKTYIHRYEGNVMNLDPDLPVDALNSWTLREMTEMGFSKHLTLLDDVELEDGEKYSPYSYGMIRSTTEKDDTEKTTFFENIDSAEEAMTNAR